MVLNFHFKCTLKCRLQFVSIWTSLKSYCLVMSQQIKIRYQQQQNHGIYRHLSQPNAEPHSSVGSIADFRTGGHWFNPWLGQYSFRGLMIEDSFLSHDCPLFRQLLCGKAASGLERILCRVLV